MPKILASLSLALFFLYTIGSAATEHKVRKGENLTEIAQEYKVSVKAIKDANNIRNANQIKVGQKLVIPSEANSPAATPATASSHAPEASSKHQVRKGETLTEIAQAYKVSVKEIEAANNITNANNITVGQTLTIPAVAPKVIEYKIRRGDNLSEIASKHGASLAEIKSLNAIRNSNQIRIGQVIRIPVNGDFPIDTAPAGPQLSSSDLTALSRIRAKSGQWRHIVIHHSATGRDSAKGMDRYHREERNMENGLAYHFVIGNGRGMGDGELYIGDRWKRQIQGGHLSSHTLNQISIGICLVGDFSKTRPTAKQMETLEALTRFLMDKTSVPVSRVTTHTLIHPHHTECPGKFFPTKSFKDKLAK